MSRVLFFFVYGSRRPLGDSGCYRFLGEGDVSERLFGNRVCGWGNRKSALFVRCERHLFNGRCMCLIGLMHRAMGKVRPMFCMGGWEAMADGCG